MSVIDSSPASAQPTGPGESGKLHRRALGVPDLVFFIVAASAPLTAVAGGQAATYLVTGNKGVPFMYIPLGIMLALFAVGYAAMSRYVTNAGACSWYEFTRAIMDEAGIEVPIEPVSTSSGGADRPLNGVLSCARAEAAGVAPLPHWRDALRTYLTRCELAAAA